MKKVFFKTFGCRTNLFDTQIMTSSLKNYQVTQNENEADAIVVNSCTVTNSADVSVRGYINQMSRNNPKVKVYLSGCGTHTKGETLFENKNVFGVFGQSEKESIDKWLQSDKRFFEPGDLTSLDEKLVEEFVGKSRAFIKIQEGCNFRCSYCIIPFVRGDARSFTQERIVEQVTKLTQNGFGEFILTGTNIGSYGSDKRSSLAKLLKRLSQIRGVRRIRLGSVEPIQINDEFKELLDEPWMSRHLHIALQHTSDEMLRIMNRRNRLKSDLELFELIASHGYALGTDFIVGHPGESEAIWREAMQNVSRFPLTHIHSFTYSVREGTASAFMKESINGNVSKSRREELVKTIELNNVDFRKKNSTTALEVLIEGKKDGFWSGYDQFFNRVMVKATEELNGDWINIENYEILEEFNYVQI